MRATQARRSETTGARLIEVSGVVQGVGFRPFVWRLASERGLTGEVRNRGGVVEIIAEGAPAEIDSMIAALRSESPPMARVERVDHRAIAPRGATSFEVDDSLAASGDHRAVPPDAATCPACLEELFDPTNRRYLYPFTNCTDCGPRFTIIEDLPYDRERTSMRDFTMCADCESEYVEPRDRRFHAEPIACAECGPTLSLILAGGSPVDGDPIESAASLLREGAIVAVKGLGGFQLACDARNAVVVAGLRMRKHRPDKPFAVMVADEAMARRFFDPTSDEVRSLASPRAPIVLVRDKGELAPSVAPGFRLQGVMLPSTPLHHLLLRSFGGPLVMTSGNISDEPICISYEEARRGLSTVADAFIVHDREIVARYDDPVVSLRSGAERVIRRARGFAPAAIRLPRSAPVAILATGALLNGAFCLAGGDRAFLSQHLGDLDTDEALDAFELALRQYRRLFDIDPQAIAHDMHPDLPTTILARGSGLPTLAVQHHQAHIAAVMAENGLTAPTLGVAFDGAGYSGDGTVWGGEFLLCADGDCHRVGHLRAVPQPGGDAAVRAPWKMALSYAVDSDSVEATLDALSEPRDAGAVLQQVATGAFSPPTTSVGRLLDAVSAIVGVCRVSSYEGQAAMLLEQVAMGGWDEGSTAPYALEVAHEAGQLILDPRPMIRAVVSDVACRMPVARIAARVHAGLADAVVRACRELRSDLGVETICLGGGVFQNELLVSYSLPRLRSAGFEVFTAREAPSGDGGLALGQALVAAERLRRGDL